MNIHEFQAKELLQKMVSRPKGYLASSPVEAELAYRRLWVLSVWLKPKSMLVW